MDRTIMIRETFTPIWHNHYGESGSGFTKDSFEDAIASIKERNKNLILPDKSQAIRKESIELIMVNPSE